MGRQLCQAAKEGKLKHVIALLGRGAAINAAGPMEKHSALMFAALGGYLPIVRVLLRRRARANQRNKYGETALIWAASSGHQAIVQELLKHKANMDIQNTYKVTALMEAAGIGHKGIVQLLLKKGARLGHKDTTNGQTALDYAQAAGFTETAAIIAAYQKRRAHISGAQEKRIRCGVELCRVLVYEPQTRFPVSSIHMGIRYFFKQYPRLRATIGKLIAQMHPILNPNYKPRPRFSFSSKTPYSAVCTSPIRSAKPNRLSLVSVTSAECMEYTPTPTSNDKRKPKAESKTKPKSESKTKAKSESKTKPKPDHSETDSDSSDYIDDDEMAHYICCIPVSQIFD